MLARCPTSAMMSELFIGIDWGVGSDQTIVTFNKDGKIMGMTKTGNTPAEGDKVRKEESGTKPDGTKFASARGGGEVMEVDPDMGTARVRWPNDEVTIEDVFKLERE